MSVTGASGTIRLSAGALEAAAAHAAEAWPDECCGLLVGAGDDVIRAQRARNAAADPRRRFLVDPADHFEAIRRARAQGLAVIGAYHSHPQGEPHPSETDRAEAFDDGQFVHLIVRPAPRDRPGTEPAVAGYRLIGGTFVELRIVRVP